MAFDADAVAELARVTRDSTVEVATRRRGGGCGIIWSDDGVIVTNAHVVGSARRARVHFHTGEAVTGDVLCSDVRRDLAEIRIAVPACGLRGATIGNAAALRVGDIVAAYGAPLGIAGAITLGVVHRKPIGVDGRLRRWVEADVRLAPGNSGGPLMDAKGQVVGVNSMIACGLALAVPSESVARFLQSRGARAWIGITVELVRFDGDSDGLGLLVFEALEHGPAARAGVRAGDVIVAADGRRFDRLGALEHALDDRAPGSPLSMEIVRGGVSRTVVVVTGAAPVQSDRAA